MRVRALDRRIGGAQDFRIVPSLVGAGEIVFVGLVGLVPYFDRGQLRVVARGQEGCK